MNIHHIAIFLQMIPVSFAIVGPYILINWFQILRDNMFNMKEPTFNNCQNHPISNPVYTGKSSYIDPVKWCDFIENKEKYLQIAEDIREKIDDYNITKTVQG